MESFAARRVDGRRRRIAALAVAALLATLLAPLPAAAAYVLPSSAEVPAGARVVGALPVADAIVVTARSAPQGAVPVDTSLAWRSLTDVTDPTTGALLDSGVAATGAPEVWRDTTRGEGALIALVDTGVTPTSDALVAELDFTATGGGDGYGHGSFLASLITGPGGVAPAASILSLKVASTDGGTDLGTVLTALQWLSGPGRDTGIQIAVLALGVDAASPAGHLLDLAVGRLAADGVLVVTAAGNDPDALSSPATAPGAFAAGAVDDQGTVDRADDLMADFSAAGLDRLGEPSPDVVASGVRVVGRMPCGAQLALAHPQAFVGDGREACDAGAATALFRGSGTSMSTALTAGVAALASSANGALDGAQLALALRAWDPAADPAGLHAAALDAPAAVTAAVAAVADDTTAPTPPGVPAHARIPAPQRPDWNGVNWRGVNWRGVNWRGVNWRDTDWTGVNWRDSDWQGVNWRGVNWRDTDWTGVNWRGVNWREDDWQGVNWRGVNWREDDWQGVNWRTGSWMMAGA